MIKYSLPVIASLALFACTSEPVAEEASSKAAPEAVASVPDMKSLQSNLSGDWRTDEAKSRDAFRNPAATLEFCGVDPATNISEIWPGGGWYSQILAPWINANGGKFNAVIIDPEISEGAANLLQRYMAQFEDKDLFGEISTAPLSADSAGFAADNSQDTVLTFRNVHSWMGRGMAEKTFADFYASLKPGGVLCVIEHRLPSSAVQSSKAGNGYVQEAMVKALAAEAGFVFEAASEINANPKDNADHPYGVWTLPPSKRSPRTDEEKAANPDFDRAAFDAIGESDRMTLRFRKPVTPEASGE
ncbi:MAG: class I SAM-dependent methyltransferase [Robiginitomaculum sp.]|nr:class I SAM-dependent methyltransferase [Robiginitomaculum sp.]